jgi:uncharacterized membrane protein
MSIALEIDIIGTYMNSTDTGVKSIPLLNEIDTGTINVPSGLADSENPTSFAVG